MGTAEARARLERAQNIRQIPGAMENIGSFLQTPYRASKQSKEVVRMKHELRS